MTDRAAALHALVELVITPRQQRITQIHWLNTLAESCCTMICRRLDVVCQSRSRHRLGDHVARSAIYTKDDRGAGSQWQTAVVLGFGVVFLRELRNEFDN